MRIKRWKTVRLRTILQCSEREGETKYLSMQEYCRCSQRSTLTAKWSVQKIFPEGMTSKPYIKEEIRVSRGKGRSWMAILGGNSGHCCHCSSYSFLQPHNAHKCYTTLVKHGACNKNYFIKNRVLNLPLNNVNNGF